MAASNLKTIKNIEIGINARFEIKSLGHVKQFLGINVTRNNDQTFKINQRIYINKIGNEFQLQDTKGSVYPMDPGYFKL